MKALFCKGIYEVETIEFNITQIHNNRNFFIENHPTSVVQYIILHEISPIYYFSTLAQMPPGGSTRTQEQNKVDPFAWLPYISVSSQARRRRPFKMCLTQPKQIILLGSPRGAWPFQELCFFTHALD